MILKPIITLVNLDPISIDFGDISNNLQDNFSLTHSRLLNTDISFDLSYILPDPNIFDSINGSIIFDPSALINSISGDISFVNYDISFIMYQHIQALAQDQV